MASVVAAAPVETAEDRERLRQLLEAQFASQRFGLLARSWAYASLPPGLFVWLVARGGLGPGWAFPAVLAWGFTAGLSLAFVLLALSAWRRARGLHAEGDRMLVDRPVAGERWLEAALLQLSGLTGALLAIAALWPSLLPVGVVTAAARGWGWSSVGAAVLLAVTALLGPSFGEIRSPLPR